MDNFLFCFHSTPTTLLSGCTMLLLCLHSICIVFTFLFYCIALHLHLAGKTCHDSVQPEQTNFKDMVRFSLTLYYLFTIHTLTNHYLVDSIMFR